jgi:hypothetical protein
LYAVQSASDAAQRLVSSQPVIIMPEPGAQSVLYWLQVMQAAFPPVPPPSPEPPCAPEPPWLVVDVVVVVCCVVLVRLVLPVVVSSSSLHA